MFTLRKHQSLIEFLDCITKFYRIKRVTRNNTMNLFKLFGCKRKLDVFSFVEGFFEFHSSTTEGEKDKIRAKNNNFLAN